MKAQIEWYSCSKYQASKQSNISVAAERQTEECRTFCQKNCVHEIQNLHHK